MKYCTRIRITNMLPNGMINGVKLLDISLVEDSHDFGLRQEANAAYSPVTRQPVTVFSPVLHIEGRKAFPASDEVVRVNHHD